MVLPKIRTLKRSLLASGQGFLIRKRFFFSFFFVYSKSNFGRTAPDMKTFAVAMSSLSQVVDFILQALVQLPSHISNSEQVLDFFESKPEDLNPSKE